MEGFLPSDKYRIIATSRKEILVPWQGWDIYPIGSNAKPGDMPKGVLAGIVIVQ